MIGPATIDSRNCRCDMSDSMMALQEKVEGSMLMLTMQAGKYQCMCKNGKAQLSACRFLAQLTGTD